MNSSLIEYYGYSTLQSICKPEVETQEDTRSLSDLIAELNALVGLKSVKAKINDLIATRRFKNSAEKTISIRQRILYIWRSQEIPELVKQRLRGL